MDAQESESSDVDLVRGLMATCQDRPTVDAVERLLATAHRAEELFNLSMEELHFEKGSLQIKLAGELGRLFAIGFAGAFLEAGAENYLEMEFRDHRPAVPERYVLTIQRVLGKTPHQLQRAAEVGRDAAVAKLSAMAPAPSSPSESGS